MSSNALPKKLIKQLRKEWQSLSLRNIAVLQTRIFGKNDALNLQASLPIPSYLIPSVTLNVTLSPGLSDQTSAYLLIDAIFPEKLPLATYLPSLCAFSQRTSALISPLTLVIDIESQQLILRQSQLIANNTPLTSRTFISSAQQLIPLLQESIDHILQASSSPEEARYIADYMVEHYEETA